MDKNKQLIFDVIVTSLSVSMIIAAITTIVDKTGTDASYQTLDFEFGLTFMFWFTTTYLIGFLFLSPLFYFFRNKFESKLKQGLMINLFVTIAIVLVITNQTFVSYLDVVPYLLVCPIFTILTNLYTSFLNK